MFSPFFIWALVIFGSIRLSLWFITKRDPANKDRWAMLGWLSTAMLALVIQYLYRQGPNVIYLLWQILLGFSILATARLAVPDEIKWTRKPKRFIDIENAIRVVLQPEGKFLYRKLYDAVQQQRGPTSFKSYAEALKYLAKTGQVNQTGTEMNNLWIIFVSQTAGDGTDTTQT